MAKWLNAAITRSTKLTMGTTLLCPFGSDIDWAFLQDDVIERVTALTNTSGEDFFAFKPWKDLNIQTENR